MKWLDLEVTITLARMSSMILQGGKSIYSAEGEAGIPPPPDKAALLQPHEN